MPPSCSAGALPAVAELPMTSVRTAEAKAATVCGKAPAHGRGTCLQGDAQDHAVKEAPAGRAGDAPSSFRSAAEIFPEVAKKAQPSQPCVPTAQQHFDDVSQSILKRDAKCRPSKRLHPDGNDKDHREWSDAWLRIADADQLERLVPALEATIHRADAADAIKKEDIAGLNFVKTQIEEVLILPRLHPELFLSALTKPARGLLLFGPPGTGKTLLAKWIAAECGATFFNVNASTVMSKWIGEAEKTVKALFQLAAEKQPSVIFLDEIDSLLSQRRDADNEASRRVKNEFLTSLEGADTDSEERILLVGATNMPWDLDHAVLRRLPKRLYVPLPGKGARRSLLLTQLAKHNSRLGLPGNLSASDIDSIVERTEGFSCSDLQQLLCEAAMCPVREIAAARIRQKAGVSQAQQAQRDIAKHDFECALRRVKPTHTEEQGLRHQAFNNEHGTCRGEDAMQDLESDAD
ncbi:FIGNL1 [Symbiodinium pilosum]|uniref:FIGNL1 protein n=1 Tax=Symbiodinium pilosum TaxID=2952 RepID=A0A812TTD0_SYMPI|nr:FIGNL1 [Symbiodinium pilosum]